MIHPNIREVSFPSLSTLCALLHSYFNALQTILYDLYPIMIASTIGVVLLIVGLNFASVGLPIRLALTIAISLCWTYGLLVSTKLQLLMRTCDH